MKLFFTRNRKFERALNILLKKDLRMTKLLRFLNNSIVYDANKFFFVL